MENFIQIIQPKDANEQCAGEGENVGEGEKFERGRDEAENFGEGKKFWKGKEVDELVAREKSKFFFQRSTMFAPDTQSPVRSIFGSESAVAQNQPENIRRELLSRHIMGEVVRWNVVGNRRL